ncbi:alkaline phosphatase PhoX [Streptomyces sp. NPDC050433]|uniref:alkaline phosphatase PhoX n=1 Tax=Streptomyces sp. NPDC050433 TaxID=3365615 RepID=UPI00379992F7
MQDALGLAESGNLEGTVPGASSLGADRKDWKAVDSAYNRRITGDSTVRFSGPVVVDGRSRGVPACSGAGITPWGTHLAAEENFNAVFGTDEPDWRRGEKHVRYGLSAGGFGQPWHRADPRFDLAAREARPDEFGWIAEPDPRHPDAGVSASAADRHATALRDAGLITTVRNGPTVPHTGTAR